MKHGPKIIFKGYTSAVFLVLAVLFLGFVDVFFEVPAVMAEAYRTLRFAILVAIPVLLVFQFLTSFLESAKSGEEDGSEASQRGAVSREELRQIVREEYVALGGEQAEVLTDEKRAELLTSLKSSLQAQAGEELLTQLAERVADARAWAAIERRFRATKDRLERERQALSNRSNLNLILGVIVSLLGFGALLYFVVTYKALNEDAYAGLAEHFVPRLSLVVFIEIFAYFFLRLYKETLQEIKYFQNELTNVESRFLSLLAAANVDDKVLIGEVVRQLAGTERNFVLQKGQTTADLEKERLNQSALVEGLKAASGVAGKAQGK